MLPVYQSVTVFRISFTYSNVGSELQYHCHKQIAVTTNVKTFAIDWLDLLTDLCKCSVNTVLFTAHWQLGISTSCMIFWNSTFCPQTLLMSFSMILRLNSDYFLKHNYLILMGTCFMYRNWIFFIFLRFIVWLQALRTELLCSSCNIFFEDVLGLILGSGCKLSSGFAGSFSGNTGIIPFVRALVLPSTFSAVH